MIIVYHFNFRRTKTYGTTGAAQKIKKYVFVVDFSRDIWIFALICLPKHGDSSGLITARNGKASIANRLPTGIRLNNSNKHQFKISFRDYIRGDKIWVQHDGTKDGIVDELMAAGVPEKQIVLGFHAPVQRKLTPFAVA